MMNIETLLLLIHLIDLSFRLKYVAAGAGPERADAILNIMATRMMSFVPIEIPFVMVSKDSGFNSLGYACKLRSRKFWRAFSIISLPADDDDDFI